MKLIINHTTDHDVLAQAQSGTGKTATFAITILQKLDMNIKDCQALVLAPTRELAQQVCVLLIYISINILFIFLYTYFNTTSVYT